MSFSNDERLITDINLDSLLQFSDYINQIRPILNQDSGYREVTDSYTLGKDVNQLNELFSQRNAGVSDTEIAKQLGVSSTDLKRISERVQEQNRIYGIGDRMRNEAMRTGNKAKLEEAVGILEQAGNIAREVQNFQLSRTRLEKTDERKSLEDRLKNLQLQELQSAEREASYANSPDFLDFEKRQRDTQRALEERQNEIQRMVQDFTKSQLERESSYANSPEFLDYQKKQQDSQRSLEDRQSQIQKLVQDLAERQAQEQLSSSQQRSEVERQQREIALARQERQRKALAGEIPLSAGLQREINENFLKLKEAEARRGNAIIGDDPFGAVAKGSAANEALKRFQDTANSLRQRELQAIIQGEAPQINQDVQLSSSLGLQSPFLGQTSASLSNGNPSDLIAALAQLSPAIGTYQPSMGVGPLTQRTSAFQGAVPNAPSYGGLSQMALSSYQPFQFDRQMQVQQAQLDAEKRDAKRAKRSGRLGAIGSLVGGGAGLAFGGPMGGAIGSQLGGGLGQLFGGY